MMKFLPLFIFIFLAIESNKIVAQEKEYNLSLTEWDFGRLGGSMGRWIWPSKYKVRPSDSAYLQNQWQVRKHQVYYMPMQKGKDGQDNILIFLAAMLDAKKGIVIMDANRSGQFADDSVYHFNLPDDEREMQRWPTGVPSWYVNVRTDSLRLRDTTGIIYRPCDFYINPEVSYGKVSKEPSIKLFASTKYYFPLRFTINNKDYEMTITANPVNQLFYTLPNLLWGVSDLLYNIKRLNVAGVSDSFFLQKYISVIDLANNPDEYPLVIDGHHIKIIKHNEDYTQLTLSFEPYVPPATPRYKPDTLYADLIEGRTTRPARLLDTKSQYTVLFFSGSWCAPCKAALPAVKKFYGRYAKQVKLKTVLAEANTAAAIKYATTGKWPWPSYFTPVYDKAAGSLQQLFKVTAFPSFVLIDKKGQLVATYTAEEGLAELETQLKGLLALEKL